MSTEMIHQDKVLVKKAQRNQWGFVDRWPLAFGPIDRCAAILVSLVVSVQMQRNTMLCWFADDPKAITQSVA